MTDRTDAYIIYKLKDGGFAIRETGPELESRYNPFLFACSTLQEALQYLEDKLNPGGK